MGLQYRCCNWCSSHLQAAFSDLSTFRRTGHTFSGAGMCASMKLQYRTCVLLVLTAFLLLSFSVHRKLLKIPTLGNICQIHSDPESLMEKQEQAMEGKSTLMEVDFPKDYMRVVQPSPWKPQLNETELQVKEIISKIDQLVPKVTFTHVDNTTCAAKSRASIMNPRDTYCVGDKVTVRLDMHDYLGNRKKYGGDLLRARIYSPDLVAGASGAITDFHNGTYQAHFTLFWEGTVKMQLHLIHPSEGVAALWRARNTGFNYIIHKGKYTSPSQTVDTVCGYQLDTKEEVCEYLKKDEYPFYCIKPAQISCDYLTQVYSTFSAHSYLSDQERLLFSSSRIREEIPHGLQDLDVLQCSNASSLGMHTCRTGMELQFPGGFFLQNVWQPLSCSMSRFTSQDEINGCLKGRSLHLIGDSTVLQWFTYITKKLTTLTELDLYGFGWFKSRLMVDTNRNIQIRFQRHGSPFVPMEFYSILENPTIAEQIDLVGGNKNTVIVFTAGTHFKGHPLHIFARRVINIRRAIQRLLVRSPETKVILKTESSHVQSDKFEKESDFHGYVQYLIMNSMLQDLNIGIVDAWDMTTAFATNNVHPPPNVIENEVNLLLTFLC